MNDESTTQPPVAPKPRRPRQPKHIVIDDTATLEKYDVIQTFGTNAGMLGIVVEVRESDVKCFHKTLSGEGNHFTVAKDKCKKIGTSFIRWKSIDSGQKPSIGQSNGQPRMLAKAPAFPPDVVS